MQMPSGHVLLETHVLAKADHLRRGSSVRAFLVTALVQHQGCPVDSTVHVTVTLQRLAC